MAKTIEFEPNVPQTLRFNRPAEPFIDDSEQYGRQWTWGVRTEDGESAYFRTRNPKVAGYIAHEIEAGRPTEIVKIVDETNKFGRFVFNGVSPYEFDYPPPGGEDARPERSPRQAQAQVQAKSQSQSQSQSQSKEKEKEKERAQAANAKAKAKANTNGSRYPLEDQLAFARKDASIEMQSCLKTAMELVTSQGPGGDLIDKAEQVVRIAGRFYDAIQRAKAHVRLPKEAFNTPTSDSDAITEADVLGRGRKLGLTKSQVVKLAVDKYGVRGLAELKPEELKDYAANMRKYALEQGLISIGDSPSE